MTGAVREIFSLRLAALKNSFGGRGRSAGMGRMVFIGLAAGVTLLLFAGTRLLFFKIFHGFPDLPELGPPLAFRIIEVIHLAFFMMLVVSALSTSFSTIYLDPEVETLLSLPIPRSSIWTRGFILTILRSSWFVFMADIPILFAHGAARSAPPLYYISIFPLLFLFVLLPAGLGAAIAAVVVAVVPAKRAKEAVLVLAVIGIASAIVILRFAEPENFMKMRSFAAVASDPLRLGEPMAPHLTPALLTGLLVDLATGATPSAPAIILLLIFGAAGVLLASAIGKRLFAAGLEKRFSTGRRTGFSGRILDSALSYPASPPSAAIISKDMRTFWRDPSQWSQTIVLLALVVIYVFNFREIRGEITRMFLLDIVAFLNIAMAGFVLVAVANRFVFSAVSMEGRAFWIIRTSPYPASRLLLSKGAASFVPLFILGEAVTVITNHALGVSASFATAAFFSVLAMTLTVTALGIGLGAMNPSFEETDPAQIGLSPAGLLFMALGMLYIGIFISLMAYPVYAGLIRDLFGLELGERFFTLVEAGIALHILFIIPPLVLGKRRLERVEI